MNKTAKKFVAYFTAIVMVLASFPMTAFAASFGDTEGHWASEAIEKWSSLGVLEGSNGNFRPNAQMTRAEMAVVMGKVMNYITAAQNNFSDLDQSWYTEAILKAVDAEVMSGTSSSTVSPRNNITREQAFTILGRALGVSESSTGANFSDMDSVSSWAAGYINALAAKGIVNGVNGNVNPKSNITRAEVVTILNNAIKQIYNEPGTYTDSASGVVVINTSGVTLSGSTISGDLIIAEGVGEGDVFLDDVTITGKMIVRGGGENSIRLRGNTKISQGTKIQKKHGKVALKSEETANPGNVEINNGTVVLSGNFGNVTINGDNVSIVIEEGTYIETLYVSGDASNIVINGEVGRIIIMNDSEDTNITVGETGVVGEIITGASLDITNNGEIGALISTNENVDNTVTGNDPTEEYVDESLADLTGGEIPKVDDSSGDSDDGKTSGTTTGTGTGGGGGGSSGGGDEPSSSTFSVSSVAITDATTIVVTVKNPKKQYTAADFTVKIDAVALTSSDFSVNTTTPNTVYTIKLLNSKEVLHKQTVAVTVSNSTRNGIADFTADKLEWKPFANIPKGAELYGFKSINYDRKVAVTSAELTITMKKKASSGTVNQNPDLGKILWTGELTNRQASAGANFQYGFRNGESAKGQEKDGGGVCAAGEVWEMKDLAARAAIEQNNTYQLQVGAVITIMIEITENGNGNLKYAISQDYTVTPEDVVLTSYQDPNKPQLTAPSVQPVLSNEGVVTFTALGDETDVVNYSLNLYKDNTDMVATKVVAKGTTSYNFLSAMRSGGVGDYTVTAVANANGVDFRNSDESAPSNSRTIEKLEKPTNLTWSGDSISWEDSNIDPDDVASYRVTVTGGIGGTTNSTTKTFTVKSPIDGATVTVKAIAKTTGLYIDSDESDPSDAYIPPLAGTTKVQAFYHTAFNMPLIASTATVVTKDSRNNITKITITLPKTMGSGDLGGIAFNLGKTILGSDLSNSAFKLSYKDGSSFVPIETYWSATGADNAWGKVGDAASSSRPPNFSSAIVQAYSVGGEDDTPADIGGWLMLYYTAENWTTTLLFEGDDAKRYSVELEIVATAVVAPLTSTQAPVLQAFYHTPTNMPVTGCTSELSASSGKLSVNFPAAIKTAVDSSTPGLGAIALKISGLTGTLDATTNKFKLTVAQHSLSGLNGDLPCYYSNDGTNWKIVGTTWAATGGKPSGGFMAAIMPTTGYEVGEVGTITNIADWLVIYLDYNEPPFRLYITDSDGKTYYVDIITTTAAGFSAGSFGLDAFDPDTVNPETVDPETVDPETVNPETVNPETVDPETVNPETVDPETI